ncbi:hypothetical protein L5515_012463 [Caenorhabditis briggsae]|uniref:G-protein coupled receptors family 1 profile domain-containing protein n=1 Tax=Caenorhabditis briggsae TaxID=6238 RepID=A0AAE9JH45_CAEBR|nr:hypothetical protein L5515_012463 [Caenorhabditis briggsae]
MADTDEFSATGGEDRGNVSKRQLSVSKRKAISHYQAVRTSQTHLQNNGSVPKQAYRNSIGKLVTLSATLCYLTEIFLNLLMTIHRVSVLLSPGKAPAWFSDTKLFVYCSALITGLLISLLIPYYSTCYVNFNALTSLHETACAPNKHPITRFQNLYLIWVPGASKPRKRDAQLVVYWGNPLRDGLQRSTPWLGISMAVLRLLIVKNSLNPKFEKLSNPKFSVVLTLVTYILSTFWSLFLYRGYSLADGNDLWQPAPSCTGFPVNYTEHQFYIQYERDVNVESDCMIEVYLFTDGLLKIIPTIVFPILTGLLIRELSAANTRRKKLTATQSKRCTRADHTTKLVVCMTAMFMAAEGPPGILLVLQGFVKNSVGFS